MSVLACADGLSLLDECVDIEDWYRRYGESVFRRCLRLCRDEQQAFDLTQEVFLRAHRYRDSFRGESGPMTWLFTLADRVFFDWAAKTRPVLAAQEVREFIAEERAGVERRFVSHDLVARLPARCPEDVRAMVVHRYFDELDLRSIADRLGVNERTVRRKLERFFERAEKLARDDV